MGKAGTMTARDVISISKAAQTAREQLQPGSPEAEEAADALLAGAKGWEADAHSERPNTKWNQKHSRHQASLEFAALQVFDQMIEPEEVITAAAAGLSERQYLVWHFVDIQGVPEMTLAARLNVSQSAISRAVCKAREELKYLIERDPAWIFRLESHRSAYFAPASRPELPEGVEEAREEMEAVKEVSTHILMDDPKLVQQWVNGEPQFDDEGKPIGKRICFLAAKIKRDRQMRVIRRKAAKRK